MLLKQKLNLQSMLSFLTKAFLFLLPWQTIWIYREINLNGYKWEYGTLGFYGTEILLWAIFFLFMIWYWKKFRVQSVERKFSLTRDRVFVFSVLLFTVYCSLSSVWAIDKNLASQQALRIMEMFLLFFILYLGPLDFKNIVKWFVLGSILPVLLGIYQFVWQTAPAVKWLGLSSHVGWEGGASIASGENLGRVLRAYGSFSHPNVFGGYLVISLLMFLLSRKSVIIFWIVYCLLLTGLFFTFSRSALLALSVVLLIYYFVEKLNWKKYLQKIIITLLPILILLIILIPVLAVRVGGDSVYETRSIDERLTGVSEAVEIIKNNLWLGVGAGNYTLALYNLQPDLPGWQYQPVHNVGLLILAELGSVGVVLLALVFISFIFILKQENNTKKLIFGRCGFFVLVFFCFSVLAFFDHYLFSSYIGLVLTAVYWAFWARYSTQSLPS